MTTVTLISLVGETAMAGAVGAGGIGNVSMPMYSIVTITIKLFWQPSLSF